MNIFIINGSGGVGKDTFCDLCGQYDSVVSLSSITKIKEFAKTMGWSGEKTEKDRKFLSDLKDLTTNYNDLSFRDIERSVCGLDRHFYYHICFIHVREPKEIERVRIRFKAKTILVHNNNVEQIVTNRADAGVNDYSYDIHIDNSGSLSDLDKIAKEFVETYGRN